MPQTYKGEVKWFNNEKGYGFITYEDETLRTRDIFVHYSQVQGQGYKTLVAGEAVEFEILVTSRGPQAVCVYRV